MAAVHRQTDLRVCGHTTIVQGQGTVYANNLLIAVDKDPDNAGGGNLIAACKNVYINGKMVVNNTPDHAEPDSECPVDPHCDPYTAQGSPNVFVGD
jgi:hypothetical protein